MKKVLLNHSYPNVEYLLRDFLMNTEVILD